MNELEFCMSMSDMDMNSHFLSVYFTDEFFLYNPCFRYPKCHCSLKDVCTSDKTLDIVYGLALREVLCPDVISISIAEMIFLLLEIF
jgi:hypothetical protein